MLYQGNRRNNILAYFESVLSNKPSQNYTELLGVNATLQSIVYYSDATVSQTTQRRTVRSVHVIPLCGVRTA